MARVSVIIPAYNAESTIARAVNSALAQHFEGAEVVVVDDGSTDSTTHILGAYGSPLRVVRQANRGPAVARNAAARASGGEYLAFLDADDVWLPDKLAKTVAALEVSAGAVLAYSEYFSVADDGRVAGTSHLGPPPTMNSMLTNGWEKVTSTVVMRRAAFERCGGFSEEFRTPGLEDLWTWLLAREQGDFVHVPEPLVMYRNHSAPGSEYRYLATRRVFLRLLRARYGSRARVLRRRVNRFFAALFFAAASRELRAGRAARAFSAAARSLYYYPAYPLEVLRERAGHGV